MLLSVISFLIKHNLNRHPVAFLLQHLPPSSLPGLLAPYSETKTCILNIPPKHILWTALRSDEGHVWMPYATFVFVTQHWNYCKDKWLWDSGVYQTERKTTIFVLVLTSQRIFTSQNSSLEWHKVHCGSTWRLQSSLDFGEDNSGPVQSWGFYLGKCPTDSSKSTMLKSSRRDYESVWDCMRYVSVIHFWVSKSARISFIFMFSGLFLILLPLLLICCENTLPDRRKDAKISGLASFARDTDGRV